MVFSSNLFLFLFLPLVIIGYLFFRSNIWLLICSLFFYAWGEPRYIFLMLFSITFNYCMGRCIDKHHDRCRKVLFISTIAVDVLLLVVFKYLAFVITNINTAFSTTIPVIDLALPIGISFYTFQVMSYIIDLYKDRIKVQKNILDLALYISLFPQLIAGPIVRYSVVEKEIKSREYTLSGVRDGMQRFAIGLSKKVLLADRISVMADIAFSQSDTPMLLAWIGAFAYTLQIYFDFSGYSDMAIGLGRVFGFHFDENFDNPYYSLSAKEFWKRWHISLSGWFRDYVYIPLGGSRVSSARMIFNYLVVFALTGLWHGASWNFLVWGLYHVLFILCERFIWGKVIDKLPIVIRWIYSFNVVLIGWVFFRADNLSSAVEYIKCMLNIHNIELYYSLGQLDGEKLVFIIIASLIALPISKKIKGLVKKQVASFIIDIAFILSLLYVLCGGFSPFLYFRF